MTTRKEALLNWDEFSGVAINWSMRGRAEMRNTRKKSTRKNRVVKTTRKDRVVKSDP